ncbi:MAG: fumarylacetoacetate hydrolase family protein [Bdellovibrionales bacterium]|nr:fumarylacetoacetate hydrolase family protein [Bdellovibrionales bacterium]
MKLFRFYEDTLIRPGVQLSSGKTISLLQYTSDIDEEFFSSGKLEELPSWLAKHEDRAPALEDKIKYSTPIARPSKIICIGLNYSDHAQETGASLPTEPKIFMKATSALAEPDQPVVLPPNSQHTDYEVELAVVIGKRASYVTVESALDFVAGYSLMNDYSERHWQKDRCGQWVKGKSFDSFAPLGPFLVTKDEIVDPHNLRLYLSVNGEVRQESSTAQMIFKIPEIVSYLSHCMSLLPGDVISTGTPSGVGLGMKPAQFLKVGDRVAFGIDGVGSMEQTVEQSAFPISW